MKPGPLKGEYTKDANTGAIIGGGVLGLETAWSLAKKGKKIYVVEGNPYILSKQLDEPAPGILKYLGEKSGIEFILSGKLDRIEGDIKAAEIILKDGRQFKIDFVIFSTGVRPNIQVVDPSEVSVTVV